MSAPAKVNPLVFSQFSNDALWQAHRAFAAARDLLGEAERQAGRAFNMLEGMDAVHELLNRLGMVRADVSTMANELHAAYIARKET